MDTPKRIQILNAEIERLKQVRALLSGDAIKSSSGPPVKKKALTGAQAIRSALAKK
jgi:hypothetical protein